MNKHIYRRYKINGSLFSQIVILFLIMISSSVFATNIVGFNRFETNTHKGPSNDPESLCAAEVGSSNYTGLTWVDSRYTCHCLARPNGTACAFAFPVCPAGYVSPFWISVEPNNPEKGCHSTPEHEELLCSAKASTTPPLACALPEGKLDPIKNNGNRCPVSRHDPINTATGNSYQTETDYQGSSVFPLSFRRYYNSLAQTSLTTSLGEQWRHTFSRTIQAFDVNSSIQTVSVLRPDGQGYYFTLDGGMWGPDVDVTLLLTEITDVNNTRTGWELKTNNDDIESYDATGKLLTITNKEGLTQTLNYELSIAQGGDDNPQTLDQVTGPFGRTLNFTYVNGLLGAMADPAGEVYQYAYNNDGYLSSVTYPDETPAVNTDNPQRLYLYEDPNFPQALTGIIDENNERYSTWAFDVQGRAYMNEHAGGVNHGEIIYNTDGTATVTYVSGRVETLHFTNLHGVAKVASIDGDPCSQCGGQNKTSSYDTNGFMSSSTDWKGNITNYEFNSRGLEEERIEALGASQERRITTQWHLDFRVPEVIKVYDSLDTLVKTTTNTYDTQGRLESQTIQSDE